MHIERVREKIVTGVLITATDVLTALGAEICLRPDIKPRADGNVASSLLNPPGPETIRRSSASNDERLNIPLPPFQK